MSLTDLVSGASLDAFASASLAIFLVVFVAVVARAMRMPGRVARAASRMPLDEGEQADAPAKELHHG